MDSRVDKDRVDVVLGNIDNNLASAYKGIQHWDTSAPDNTELVEYYVEKAFVETMVLLEALGLNETLDALRKLNEEAKVKYSRVAMADDLYLVWASKLEQYLEAIKDVLGGTKSGTVTKDLIQILRATQYSITDVRCFPSTPSGEADVHVRIEAVLRCLFSDLRTKPPIAKPIKNFEPDTGIPSLKTLIEYKFISSEEDAKRVADEVLADTRGYVSLEWDKFVYLVYETRRIKPEGQWNALLKSCGADQNTSLIVISGEPPGNQQSKGKASVKTTKGER